MADDITLTVHVRDMTRGQFQRLDREMHGLRGSMRQLGQDSNGASDRMRRLDQSLGAVQGRMRRLHQTGQMTTREMQHMRDSMNQVSREALHAARSGEITGDQYKRLRREIDSTRLTFDHLNRDIRLHRTQLRGTANDAERAAMAARRLQMQEERLRISQDRLRLSQDRFRMSQNRVSNAMRGTSNNSNLANRAFTNMRGRLIGVAVVLAASLLPTIGALAPMLAGIGAIAGVAALAFAGLSRPTSKLTQDQKKFKEGLKPVTQEFRNLQQAAQKAVLPGLTKALPNVTKAVKALNPVLKIGGKALGDLIDKISKGIGSKDFMGPFVKNVKMGTVWVGQFAGSFGKFLKSFFEFGTKSKPALNAWQDLLGGFLDRGLPGMFTSMESGIKGSSDYLKGLSAVINDGLLPGLGKVIGKFMEAFGPILGEVLTTAAGSLKSLGDIIGEIFIALGPVVRYITDFSRGMAEIGRIGLSSIASGFKEIGLALVSAFTGSKLSSFTQILTGLDNWAKTHQVEIRSAFTSIGDAIITMVRIGIESLPKLMILITQLGTAAITALGVIITSAAKAFGWVPGIGGKLKNAAKSYKDWSSDAIGALAAVTQATGEYAGKAGPQLARAELKFNVDQAKSAIQDIKNELKDPELTKERKAQLTVQEGAAKKTLAEAERKLAQFDKKQAKAKLSADGSSFFDVIGKARRMQIPPKKPKISADGSSFFDIVGRIRRLHIPTKRGNIGANPSSFWSAVHRITGRTLGTSYINVVQRAVNNIKKILPFSANGNIFNAYADGGENHTAQIAPAGAMRVWAEPETGGEAYIPFAPTKRSRSRAIATETVDRLGGSVEWYAKGGTSQAAKAEKAARSAMSGQFGISFFGKIAGYKHDPYEVATGKPQSLGELVSALNGLRSQIKAAFHGKQESSLLGQLTKAGKALIKYEKKLTDVNKKLDAAKTKLDDLKQAAASLRESVSSGVMSATDITQVANGSDKNITTSDILAQMTQNRDKASAFSSALKSLQKKGVSKDIINQIAQAGISGGGLETAGALLSASSSDIASINSMQKQINASAKSAGKTAADSMYAAGIKAADGLVKGLTKKKKDIEDAMMKIAKSMEKAIKHALGIKSPSKVMQQVGHYTAEGFAVGIQKNKRIDTAWHSMLTTQSSSGSRSTGTGGVYTLPIYIGGKYFDEIILDTNRRLVRTRGGNVQNTFGRK